MGRWGVFSQWLGRRDVARIRYVESPCDPELAEKREEAEEMGGGGVGKVGMAHGQSW